MTNKMSIIYAGLWIVWMIAFGPWVCPVILSDSLKETGDGLGLWLPNISGRRQSCLPTETWVCGSPRWVPTETVSNLDGCAMLCTPTFIIP